MRFTLASLKDLESLLIMNCYLLLYLYWYVAFLSEESFLFANSSIGQAYSNVSGF